MVRLSSNVMITLNLLTFLLSIPMVWGGIWLAVQGGTDCDMFLRWPVLCIGALLMLVSLVGFIAACCRITWLLWLHLFVMFMLIILLFCFTVFAFVVINKGAREAVSRRGYKEYRLGDYSNWLQKRVEKASNWRKIKSCIQDAKLCKSLRNETEDKFKRRNISPIQSGCCKPPSSCGFEYHDATNWVRKDGATKGMGAEPDCGRWSNDQGKLCYDCDSCRAGYVVTVKRDWQKIAVADVAVLVILVVVYAIGCCALRNGGKVYNRFGDKP